MDKGVIMVDVCFVVPVYKVKEEYLRKCVESLQAQQGWSVQIVLVDDCSPDNCGAVCDQLAQGDDRITVIHKEKNEGVSRARTTGLTACNAKWVSFVDSDDWLDTDLGVRIGGHLAAAPQEPDILIFSGYRSYPSWEDPDMVEAAVKTWSRSEDTVKDLQIMAMTTALKGTPVYTLSIESVCAKLYKVAFLKESGVHFSAIPHREDCLFIQEILDEAGFVMQVPEYGYHYRMTGGSAVNKFRKDAPAEQRAFVDLLFAHAKKKERSAAYEKALYVSAFLSMQIVITQHFFHPDNPADALEKQRACAKYFAEEPFRSVFRHVKMSEWKRNHLIKALCIRSGWFAGVSVLRNLYFRKKDFDVYE